MILVFLSGNNTVKDNDDIWVISIEGHSKDVVLKKMMYCVLTPEDQKKRINSAGEFGQKLLSVNDGNKIAEIVFLLRNTHCSDLALKPMAHEDSVLSLVFPEQKISRHSDATQWDVKLVTANLKGQGQEFVELYYLKGRCQGQRMAASDIDLSKSINLLKPEVSINKAELQLCLKEYQEKRNKTCASKFFTYGSSVIKELFTLLKQTSETASISLQQIKRIITPERYDKISKIQNKDDRSEYSSGTDFVIGKIILAFNQKNTENASKNGLRNTF
jgi:hypothetical protein